MLFRAIFWIGLVSILLPREADLGPYLGLSRPPSAFGGALSSAVKVLVARRSVCEPHAVCTPNWGKAEAWQDGILRQLAQIKADIEAQERARAAHPD